MNLSETNKVRRIRELLLGPENLNTSLKCPFFSLRLLVDLTEEEYHREIYKPRIRLLAQRSCKVTPDWLKCKKYTVFVLNAFDLDSFNSVSTDVEDPTFRVRVHITPYWQGKGGTVYVHVTLFLTDRLIDTLNVPHSQHLESIFLR